MTTLCQCLSTYTSQKAQLRAPLSPLQTAWTSFDPYLYRGGSSSGGPAPVETATARSFILIRGIVTDIVSVRMSLMSIKDLAVAVSSGAC